MNLAVLGINFRTAPLEIREQASFSVSETPGALQRIAAAFPGAELVLLSTCNRTELYMSGLDAVAHKRELARSLLKNADAQLAAHCRRIARIEEGRIVSDEAVASPKDAALTLAAVAAPAA